MHLPKVSKRLVFAGMFLVMLTLLLAGRSVVGNQDVVDVAEAAPGEVLIFDPAGFDGGSGTADLAGWFTAAGKTPVVVSPATWSTMTTAQFAAYDAIALPDPTCYGSGGNDSAAAALIANASVWGPAVDGNVIVIGTDEVFHDTQGGDGLMDGATDFVVAEAGKTGAYISLSCYYHGVSSGYSVPWLDAAFGGTWTVTGVGCFNDAHIVATHPALAAVTDATLSNWFCSVHEGIDSWPVSFEVLAIAEGIGAVYTATDGTTITPYIVARGVEVISDIDLAPETAVNPIGTTHTVTATVTDDSSGSPAPVVGTTVTFTVIAGPHTGTTGTDVTDSSGQATFTYTGTTIGIDTIEATFVDAAGRTQRSNRVTKEWVEAPPPPPDPIAALEAKADRLESKLDGLGTTISGTWTAVNILEGKADRLEGKLDGQGASIRDLSNAVAALEGKADRLEGKADRLEGKIDVLQSQFNAFDADVRATLSIFGDNLAALESKADRLEAKADAHQNQFNAFDIDVRGELLIHRGALEAIEAKADRLEGKVDTLSSLIRDISGGVGGALNALEGKADRLEVKSDTISSMVSKIIDEGIDIGTIEVKTGKRFFLQTTLGGTLVNARLVKFLGFRSKTSPGTAVDLTSYVTQSSISTGVLDVSLSMPRTWHSPGYFKIFQFTVSYTDGAGQVHEGSQMAYRANDREED